VPAALDPQLRDATVTLAKFGIRYWMDSGTLLGLERDGQLLSADRDIDLSIWESDLEALMLALPDLRTQDYRIEIQRYQDKVFEIKLFPFEREARSIDIKVFRTSDDGFAWSPCLIEKFTKPEFRALFNTPRFVPLGQVTNHLAWRLVRRSWWFTQRAIVKVWKSRILQLDVDRHFFPKAYYVGTWWIPYALLEGTVQDAVNGLSKPRLVNEYLQFRYGNWHIPTSDWSYLRDDGGLKHENPLTLLSTAGCAPKARRS